MNEACIFFLLITTINRRVKLFGSNAENLVINVPPGITALTDSGVVVGELNKENDELVIAKGGRGASPENNYQAETGI